MDILLALAHCPPKVTNERSYAEEALALALQAGDEAKEAHALLTLAMFNAEPGQQAPSDSGPLDLIAQARGMAERRGADEVLLNAAVNESHLLEGAGEHERAAEAARRATVSADPQLLSRTSGSVLAVNQAEPLYALGRWNEALKITSGAMDLYLSPGPMHRALLQIITGSIALARGDLAAGAQAALAARDALGSARYEDQHQLPLARLEILLALGKDGPAAALAVASRVMDRFELSGSSPRYAWPVVAAGASAVLAAAGQAGVAHDERLRDEAAALAERLRTVAEKLATFGPAQHAFQLTFAATDAHAARLLWRLPRPWPGGRCRRAVHLAQDGQRPRVQHLGQAGRRQPRRGRGHGTHPPPFRPHQYHLAAASGGQGVNGGIHAVVGCEEPVQARKGKQPENLWSGARQRELGARGLRAPVSVHQDGHSGGVTVGDSGQIKDQPALARGVIETGAELGPGVIIELAGHRDQVRPRRVSLHGDRQIRVRVRQRVSCSLFPASRI